jgi:hypothetical protein
MSQRSRVVRRIQFTVELADLVLGIPLSLFGIALLVAIRLGLVSDLSPWAAVLLLTLGANFVAAALALRSDRRVGWLSQFVGVCAVLWIITWHAV